MIGRHATVPHRRQVFIKFILLVLVLLGYLGYLTHTYDFRTGSVAAALTWSFFVLCTPVADAGFLLDLPLRLLFGIRMFVSEVAVWGVAIAMNVVALIFFPQDFETTALTRLLHSIITTPWPYWSVVVISGAGTFLSIKFGDELMDVLHHRERHHFHRHGFKHELLMLAFAFAISLIAYYEVIKTLGIDPGH
ncbi:MAG: hypothetical protein GY952_18400 [Rhodobacteraceae bacterium]|nr:hypothetical protein [Paracoccaceae bacterium]